jgi:hypothetical protein
LKTWGKTFLTFTKNNSIEGRKWSDIVAGRHPDISETKPYVPQPIRTVITSRPPQYLDETHELETKKTTKPPTGNRRNKYRQTKKPNITIWGDSHARGIASELLHQLNYSYKITRHVKPNAGV